MHTVVCRIEDARKTLILKVTVCSIPSSGISTGILSPGYKQSWLINGAVVVIEYVSPPVEGGQARHTVVYIECVFVPALDASLKASLKDPL